MSFYSTKTQWDIKQSIAKSKAERELVKQKVDTTPSDVRCYRCKNHIWISGGVYFRPKDGKTWFPFCRVDCAELHVGNKAKLYSFEEYMTLVMHKAIKEKP